MIKDLSEMMENEQTPQEKRIGVALVIEYLDVALHTLTAICSLIGDLGGDCRNQMQLDAMNIVKR